MLYEHYHVFDQLKSDIRNYEKALKAIGIKIDLSKQKLKEQLNSESEFENFKKNYDTLYQKYMHRSHAPFNTVFGMGKQDADENTSMWNQSIFDDRPHRDIFYSPYKDFEKINAQRKKRVTRSNGRHRMRNQNTPPEYKVLNSIKWNE